MGVRSSVAGVWVVVLGVVDVVVRVGRGRVRGRVRGVVRPALQRVGVGRGEPSREEVLGLLRDHRAELSRTPRAVLSAAEEAGVSRRTLRRWVRRHGVKRLELSLEVGLGDEELRNHLASHSLPPVWALEMLAETGPVETGSTR